MRIERLLNQLDFPRTRDYLVMKLNIPRSTLYDNLEKLIKKNIIQKFSKSNGKRGRPAIFFVKKGIYIDMNRLFPYMSPRNLDVSKYNHRINIPLHKKYMNEE